MPYVIFVQNTETGKVEEIGAFEKLPMIIPNEGESFHTKIYGIAEFLKPDN